jgi:hypothetical protein
LVQLLFVADLADVACLVQQFIKWQQQQSNSPAHLTKLQ